MISFGGISRFLLVLTSVYIALPTCYADIPNCDFEDTVNITASQKFTNGSYLYEGVIIPPHLVGVYDYEELYEGIREPAAEHIRGCVCQLKRCVKFCCHPQQLRIEQTRECQRELTNELSYSPYVRITLDNSSQVDVHVLDEFVVQLGVPCHDAYALSPLEYKEDKWELFENGTLLRLIDKAYFSRRDYCLTPYQYNGVYTLNPVNCPVKYMEPPTLAVNSIVMLVSIPFLVATILVYALIPQLRNLHGECLISYLVSLAIGYTMIVVVAMGQVAFSNEVCSFIGFSAYYFLMAAFFWLSVICFDLWYNFRGTTGSAQHVLQRKRFYFYSLYAWGFPVLLTGITVACQMSDIKYSLKPGIGDDYCWLKMDDWSAMLYFYGPNLLLIIFNIVMFTLTSIKIYKIKKELLRLSDRNENRRHLRSQQDNVGLFLRLFIVMGVAWVLEVAAYMVGSWSQYSKFFYVSDIYNAAQGIVIFVLFVLKPKVLALIKKRVCSLKAENQHNPNRRTPSYATTSTTQISTKF